MFSENYSKINFGFCALIWSPDKLVMVINAESNGGNDFFGRPFKTRFKQSPRFLMKLKKINDETL